MAEDQLEPFQRDYALFIEAGFVAVKQLDELSATRLFRAAELLQPDNPAAQVGLGYIALNKLEIRKAIDIFGRVVEAQPDHHLAKVFLGMAHLMKKDERPKGESLIKEAMKQSDDPSVLHLGEVALQWADKDLKKGAAPFFTQSEGREEKDSE